MRAQRAFTLIELLIVVAIISILASIAIPHYYDAVVRAKVARTVGDMSYLSRLITAYQVDEGGYPVDNVADPFSALYVLTTPVSYTQTLPIDVFRARNDTGWDKTFFYGRNKGDYDSLLAEAADAHNVPSYAFGLASYGPDTVFSHGGIPDTFPYDATNGTISEGNIWRFGP